MNESTIENAVEIAVQTAYQELLKQIKKEGKQVSATQSYNPYLAMYREHDQDRLDYLRERFAFKMASTLVKDHIVEVNIKDAPDPYSMSHNYQFTSEFYAFSPNQLMTLLRQFMLGVKLELERELLRKEKMDELKKSEGESV